MFRCKSDLEIPKDTAKLILICSWEDSFENRLNMLNVRLLPASEIQVVPRCPLPWVCDSAQTMVSSSRGIFTPKSLR